MFCTHFEVSRVDSYATMLAFAGSRAATFVMNAENRIIKIAQKI